MPRPPAPLSAPPAGPTDAQRPAVEGVRYSRSKVVLHTDPSLMPGGRDSWMSWNYGKLRVDGETRCFVTLDPPGPVDAASVIAEFDYTHPVIDMALRERQSVIYDANEGTRVKLCGSYFHSKQLGPDQIGSHEAAFAAGAEAAAQLLHERS